MTTFRPVGAGFHDAQLEKAPLATQVYENGGRRDEGCLHQRLCSSETSSRIPGSNTPVLTSLGQAKRAYDPCATGRMFPSSLPTVHESSTPRAPALIISMTLPSNSRVVTEHSHRKPSEGTHFLPNDRCAQDARDSDAVSSCSTDVVLRHQDPASRKGKNQIASTEYALQEIR